MMSEPSPHPYISAAAYERDSYLAGDPVEFFVLEFTDDRRDYHSAPAYALADTLRGRYGMYRMPHYLNGRRRRDELAKLAVDTFGAPNLDYASRARARNRDPRAYRRPESTAHQWVHHPYMEA